MSTTKMRKRYVNILKDLELNRLRILLAKFLTLFFLFSFIQEQNLQAQSRSFQDTLTICRGDTAQLEGWVNLVQCPCTLGPCSPIVQPDGKWESPSEIICEDCIYAQVYPTTTTLYRHTTPNFRCPPPPPGSGPAPPAGPTHFGALVETLVIVKDCPTPCASTRGTFFFEDCDDGTPFFFVRLADGRILDPYFAEGIDFVVRDGQKVNFDFSPAPFPTPCSIAEQAIILTCVEEEIIPATPTENCVCDLCGVSNPLTLPWVQKRLNLPYVLRMDVFWNPISQQVQLGEFSLAPDAGMFLFDCTGNVICHIGGIGGPQIHNCDFDPTILERIGSFKKAGDTPLCGADGSTYSSYCAAECAGVSIVKEGACDPIQKNLFAEYPWLNGIVDTFNCQGTVISEYDLGPYAFIYVESPFSSILFFEDGTYYCFSKQGYDCLALYGLTEEQLTAQYICGDGQGQAFLKYPWLNNVLDLENCCENLEVIEYQSGIYSFIYVRRSTACSDGLGTLYFQDGTYYCGEVPEYDCRSAYNLNPADGNLIWECFYQPNIQEQPAVQQLALTKGQTPQLFIYPNPVSDILTIEIQANAIGQLRLYDLYGRTLEERKLDATGDTNLKMDLSAYEKGIYFLEWRSGGQSMVKKVIYNPTNN